MPEPLREVWVRTRADGTRSVGLYHRGQGDWVTQERLTIATAEMVQCTEAVRAFGALLDTLETLTAQGEDLSQRFDLADERTRAMGNIILAAKALKSAAFAVEVPRA